MQNLNRISDDLYWMPANIRPLGIYLDLKMIIVRLDDKTLTLISPIRFDHNQKQVIEGLGSVTKIIAPNLFHHLYVNHALREFPNASLLIPPGLAAKRRDLKNFTEASELNSTTLSQTFVEGMPSYNELVFCHHPSRTLIVSDLIFNIQKVTSWKEHLFWSLNGAYKKPTPSRIFKAFVKDKRLLRQSVDRILSWDFDRVIMSHGEPIEQKGKEAIKNAFAWLSHS